MNDGDHGCVVRISLWGLRKAVLATSVEESDRAMATDGTTKALVGEFQHKMIVIVSLHHGNHSSVVRIFEGHSEVVKRLLFNYLRGTNRLPGV